MGIFRGLCAALVGAGIVLATTSSAGAADTMITGCNQRNAGEIGVRELVGNVGDTISVAITIHADTDVGPFGLRLAYPTQLLQFVRVDRAILTENFFLFGGTAIGDVIQVSGTSCCEGANPIPSGAVGQMARVVFEVIAPGTGTFTTGDYVDDLTTYRSCESTHLPTPVEKFSWGRVKSRYLNNSLAKSKRF